MTAGMKDRPYSQWTETEQLARTFVTTARSIGADEAEQRIADKLDAHAVAAVAAEREACAKECGELYAKWVTESLQLRLTDQEAAKAAAAKTFACHEIAAAIRARGPVASTLDIPAAMVEIRDLVAADNVKLRAELQVWREAVQAIGDEYGILKYRICEEILAEVERRTKGASDGP